MKSNPPQKYGVPVRFPNGSTYRIQGYPICSNFEERYPELSLALASDDGEAQAYSVVKLQHPQLKRQGFCVDLRTLKKVERIFYEGAEAGIRNPFKGLLKDEALLELNRLMEEKAYDQL